LAFNWAREDLAFIFLDTRSIGATALTEEKIGDDGLEHRWVHIDMTIKLMKEVPVAQLPANSVLTE
jgi:hypothetical protein